MQIVHGLWTTTKREGPGLVLWLEDASLRLKNQLFEPISDFTPGAQGKSRGKSQLTPDPHPFCLEPRPALQAVSEMLRPHFQSTSPVLSSTTIELLLPCGEDQVLPSPWMKKGYFGKSHEVTAMALEPFRVHAVHLPPPTALKWLISCNPARRREPRICGESIQYWKDAANLVFYCLIHGTYQPSLRKVDHQIRAKWTMDESILANQLENLYKRLPQSCEAEWFADGTRRTQESIVRDFFDTAIDCLIRHVVGSSALDSIVTKRASRKRKKQNPLDSLILPYLKALYGRQNAFSAARDVQTAFVALVSNWLGQSGSSRRQWRTCFTLLPPEIGKARIEDIDPGARVWRLAFSLQSLRDPSQHIYAQEIWENLVPTQTSEGATLTEHFLKDLGRALQYLPQLRDALQAPYPTHVDLTTEEAYLFLSEHGLRLQTADFGVVAPQWWKKDTKRLKTKITLDSSAFEKKGMLGFDSTVNFSWKASVGGKALTDRAFHKLVKHKMALLPLDGEWVEVRPEDLWSTVSFFDNRETRGSMTLREAMHLGLKRDDVQDALEEVEFDYQGSLAQLFDHEGESVPILDQPINLDGRLRPYQLRGLSWLAFHDRLGFGACLADDMGLGKTIQLLSLLLYERETGQVMLGRSPTLLVCPMSVVTNWYREAKRFTPSLRAMIHHGSNRLDRDVFLGVYSNYDLIITTYHLVNRDSEIFNDIAWHRVALDEAQNIKNPNAQQSQAILGLDARRRIALTGTPVENKLSELWSIMEFLNPGYMGSLKSFQTKFAAPIERQQDQEKAKLLKRLTQPFILRRLKTDKAIIQDLPDKIEMKVYCGLTEEQAAIYQAYVNQQMNQIESAQGIQRNQLVFTTLMKLKQICNHPAQFFGDGSDIPDRSGKLMRLTEMLEEALEEGDKSLIFTQFTQMGIILDKYLAKTFGQDVLFMHGGVSQEARAKMVDRFQSAAGPKIFILTVKTGGTGLNLTAASHVFHFDRWWNPAVENQATDRAFRIGQRQNVQVHKLISTGTLEDRIDMMIEKKRELAENIIGTDEKWITQLSTDVLKDILSLSQNGS